ARPAGKGNVPGVLYNGEIYVVGGGTAPGAQFAYNPTTNSWRTIAVLPTTNGLCESGNGFVLNNEVWIVGCLGDVANQVYIYNSGTNSWRAGPANNVNHQGPGTALFNTRGFVVGGGSAGGGSTAVESMAPCGPSPTPTSPPQPPPACGGPATWQPGPAQPPARFAFQAALGTDNMLYVAGGQTTDAMPILYNQVSRYNFTTNTWSNVAPLPVALGQ